MAPGDDDDFPSIGTKCFELCKLLGNQGLAFSFNLTFGTFCFSLDTIGMRSSPAQVPVKKKKSPSAVKRDKRRRIAFLRRKDAASSSGASSTVLDTLASSGTGNPSPVDTMGAAATQRDTLDINQTNDTPGLKIRVEKSAAGKWSISPSLSRRNSASSKPDPDPDGKENVNRSTKSEQSQPLNCRNCYQPFLLNHQCDEGYYLDDDDQYGDSDDDDDDLKQWRGNLAFKCKCSLHSADFNDNSPQPQKPRNSWRQLDYPDHCNMKLLRDGIIKIPHNNRWNFRF